jgi:hypothetical protein
MSLPFHIFASTRLEDQKSPKALRELKNNGQVTEAYTKAMSLRDSKRGLEISEIDDLDNPGFKKEVKTVARAPEHISYQTKPALKPASTKIKEQQRKELSALFKRTIENRELANTALKKSDLSESYNRIIEKQLSLLSDLSELDDLKEFSEENLKLYLENSPTKSISVKHNNTNKTYKLYLDSKNDPFIDVQDGIFNKTVTYHEGENFIKAKNLIKASLLHRTLRGEQYQQMQKKQSNAENYDYNNLISFLKSKPDIKQYESKFLVNTKKVFKALKDNQIFEGLGYISEIAENFDPKRDLTGKPKKGFVPIEYNLLKSTGFITVNKPSLKKFKNVAELGKAIQGLPLKIKTQIYAKPEDKLSLLNFYTRSHRGESSNPSSLNSSFTIAESIGEKANNQKSKDSNAYHDPLNSFKRIEFKDRLSKAQSKALAEQESLAQPAELANENGDEPSLVKNSAVGSGNKTEGTTPLVEDAKIVAKKFTEIRAELKKASNINYKNKNISGLIIKNLTKKLTSLTKESEPATENLTEFKKTLNDVINSRLNTDELKPILQRISDIIEGKSILKQTSAANNVNQQAASENLAKINEVRTFVPNSQTELINNLDQVTTKISEQLKILLTDNSLQDNSVYDAQTGKLNTNALITISNNIDKLLETKFNLIDGFEFNFKDDLNSLLPSRTELSFNLEKDSPKARELRESFRPLASELYKLSLLKENFTSHTEIRFQAGVSDPIKSQLDKLPALSESKQSLVKSFNSVHSIIKSKNKVKVRKNLPNFKEVADTLIKNTKSSKMLNLLEIKSYDALNKITQLEDSPFLMSILLDHKKGNSSITNNTPAIRELSQITNGENAALNYTKLKAGSLNDSMIFKALFNKNQMKTLQEAKVITINDLLNLSDAEINKLHPKMNKISDFNYKLKQGELKNMITMFKALGGQ